MTLQEQIRKAWEREGSMARTDEYIADNVSWAVGLLTGAGFPNAAMFVLAMGHNTLGHDHPDMMALRHKLGLPQ